jgi:Phosphatidylinositol-specific phospholipase C, Y domain
MRGKKISEIADTLNDSAVTLVQHIPQFKNSLHILHMKSYYSMDKVKNYFNKKNFLKEDEDDSDSGSEDD